MLPAAYTDPYAAIYANSYLLSLVDYDTLQCSTRV